MCALQTLCPRLCILKEYWVSRRNTIHTSQPRNGHRQSVWPHIPQEAVGPEDVSERRQQFSEGPLVYL